ncbi:hypothetical protein AAF712_013431 [Marasmius tenuissimus]|uniref:Protein kinase domain-containing protein n=1 Tax=Marasmius tenuissimus TaxID=585030 RepID=A0ABR2ZDN3_9AGAR
MSTYNKEEPDNFPTQQWTGRLGASMKTRSNPTLTKSKYKVESKETAGMKDKEKKSPQKEPREQLDVTKDSRKAVNVEGLTPGATQAEELQRIQAFFKDAEKCRKVTETKGDEAQRWLDLLQALANYPEIPRQSRSTIVTVMIHLSRKSGMCPKCLKINNVERLGSHPVAGGGFGDVWKGKIGDEIVGLKVVRAFQLSDVQRLIKEYMQEAIVWQQLRHPNLLPFVGMYYFGDQLCLVSPWMEQGNLVTYLKNASPEEVDRVQLAYDVAAGLSYLHATKIVHGDMKGIFAGRVPFQELGEGAVIVAVVVDLKHPSRPEDLEIDDAIWELMTLCWNFDPSLRPTAADTLARIRRLSSTQGGSGNIQDAPDWKASNVDAIRSNVEHPPLDLGILDQL